MNYDANPLDRYGNRLCGANVKRCAECANSIAPALLRRGQGCPKHPDSEIVEGTCANRVAGDYKRCRFHGGTSPQVENLHVELDEERQARTMLERLGAPVPVDSPLTALAELAAEIRAWKEVVRDRLDDLRSLSEHDALNVDRERALVRLYGESLDRSQRSLEGLVKLDLEGRVVKVREAHVAVVLTALVKALDQLGLDAGQQRQARSLIAAELVNRATVEATSR